MTTTEEWALSIQGRLDDLIMEKTIADSQSSTSLLEQISRSVLTWMHERVRKYNYYLVLQDSARNAAVIEIETIQEPKLDEMQRYLDIMKEQVKKT